ncbi:kinase-like protein [Sanghuangporus baumii]|uniref:non-specific serine/threonine protein kinase n=1 Tax=Sanghuangporus baumii TaxID=108892 RepID=A0A9Q5HYM7_SANBA|nr:kinase-like protein [Sanghuangporus baumii]
MFSTARRHGFPSTTKHQDQQHQQQKKKGKPPAAGTTTAALSAPPTPSKSKADARTAAQAYAAAAAARPATAAAAVGSFACRPVAHAMTSVSALAAARPMTANGVATASAQQSLPTSAPSPSPEPSPVSAPSQQGLLRLAMPRASAASACATPSPLSSGLPSPTLPPLPASHFSSQPHGVVSSLSGQPAAPATAHVLRSPMINISHPHHGHGGSPLVHHARKLSANGNGIIKDELVFDYRVRPSPHTRKFSVSSVADSIAPKSLKSPKSPNSMSESSSPASRGSGRSSMLREDVFSPGDRVGAGLTLQGEVLHPVFSDNENARRDKEEPATELEVVRRLGAGSYAIVYLVREVLHHPPPGMLDGLNDDDDDDDGDNIADRSRPRDGRRLSEELELWDVPSELDLDSDPLELDGMRRKKDGDTEANKVYYGKEYAVKVLSKVGMDDEALEAQLVEANIHQSLPIHPNIVTLHRALETPSFLLLVLEFVPGEDLYYFLEQARDHYEPEPSSSCSGSTSSDSEGEEKRHKANTSVLSVNSVATMNTTRTPPTPSLLSTLNEKQLLGRRRLRLIASMFAQMCEAVAVCHDVGVYHRDIKPENFIVTDGWEEDGERRVVVVKLTDFGLSTRDAASSDMDCGSAPYMSYECRNNCAPTYAPRAADVWSLGIVLINMLYHINPWTDTTQGVCPSFSSFLAAPEHFFMQRFAGMVPTVASFLCQRVFCILPSDDPADSAGRRVSAREFGRWARELPRLMASEEPVGVPPALANVAVTASAGQKSPSSLAFPFPPKETKEKEVEKEGAVTSLSPTLPLSPTSPPSSALLAQSLAAVLAQQEAAAAVAGSSSPAWRHKRGLSNASVGYALSSIPQSRRPASRQQSFSAERSGVPSSHLGLHGISGLGSAAGSRAATPLLRGRALANGSAVGATAGASNAAGMRSRVPSYCETPAGVVGAVSELPTVFDDEREGDLSSGSLGLELQLGRQRELEAERIVEEKGGDERERSRSRESLRGAELELEREPEQEQEQEHEAEHDAEDETNATMSRSTSMGRRRKRGARRGKGAIIQQQQMEIARLQQQQEELTRQVMRMQEQLAAQQQQPVQAQQQQQEQVRKQETQERGKSQERNMNLNLQTQAQVQVLASLNPSPTATTATSASGLLAAPPSMTKALGQVHSQSLPAVPQKPTGDVLDSLASASEALARELSRAKNVRSGGVSSSSSAASPSSAASVSSPLLIPMRAISGAGTRESSPARSSISISGPNQHQQSHHRSTSSSSRPASIRTTSTTTSTTAHVGVGSKLTQRASASAAMALAGAGGPTPGAMFPVSFAAASSSSSSHGKARNGSATTTTTRSSNSSGGGVSVKNEAGNAHTGAGAGSGSGAGSVGSNAGMGTVQSQTPAPAIAKKTSKWKLSFGKGSSSSTHSRAPLPMPDVVLDISGDNKKLKLNAANDAVVAVVENLDEDGYEDGDDYDKEGGADADARRQSTSAHANADAISSEASAQQHGASSASSTASRVKSVLMSLDADLNSTTIGMNNFRVASGNSNANGNGAEPWSRGRRPAGNQHQVRPWDVSSSSSNESRWPAVERERNASPNSTRTGRSANLSPHSSSASNTGVLSSSASSLSSSSNANNNKNNWRYSTLTTSSATSGWTRYSGSNASMRSVSTVATSVSGASGTGSWRNGAGNVNRSDASLASGNGGEGRKPGHYAPGPGSIASRKSDKSSLGGMPPPNVKIMTGVPWALDELPRQLHPNPSGDIFGTPPTARKQRVRKPKDLPTISERPNQAHAHAHNQTHNHHNNNFNSSSAQQHPYNNSGSRAPPNRSPLSQRVDAARSSTSLHRSSGEGVVALNEFGEPVVREGKESDEREREGAAPRKVQKGQINALAKMLSALRR